VEFIKI